MKEKGNTPAVILGITTGVFIIGTAWFYVKLSKANKAIDDSGMKIDATTGLLVKK